MYKRMSLMCLALGIFAAINFGCESNPPVVPLEQKPLEHRYGSLGTITDSRSKLEGTSPGLVISWGGTKPIYEPVKGFASAGKNSQGYEEYRHEQTGIVFVRLPGGTFNMGSPEAETGRFECEGPVHEVRLSPFMIAKFEVSQAEWKMVMGDNPSKFKGKDLPVEQVSWEDCREFCRISGLNLPTEARWEYACRAGKEGPYSGTGKLDEFGWYGEDVIVGKTHPVGQKKPNGFGLHDMHGNVYEWCEDVYDDNFYSNPEAIRVDPANTSGSEDRVLRGGSWWADDWDCRSANREGCNPSNRDSSVGFRPVWSLSP